MIVCLAALKCLCVSKIDSLPVYEKLAWSFYVCVCAVQHTEHSFVFKVTCTVYCISNSGMVHSETVVVGQGDI